MSAATENVNRELGHLHASRRFALPTPVCVGTLLPSITQLTALGGMTRGGQRATTAFGPSGALAPRAPVGTLFRLRQTLTTRFRYWHLADRLHRCSDVRFDPKRTVDWQENREAGSEACVLRGEFRASTGHSQSTKLPGHNSGCYLRSAAEPPRSPNPLFRPHERWIGSGLLKIGDLYALVCSRRSYGRDFRHDHACWLHPGKCRSLCTWCAPGRLCRPAWGRCYAPSPLPVRLLVT